MRAARVMRLVAHGARHGAAHGSAAGPTSGHVMYGERAYQSIASRHVESVAADGGGQQFSVVRARATP